MRYACFSTPDFSSKRGQGPVSFVLIGKAVRLIRSINCITVYRNRFFSAFGADLRVEPAVFPSISSIIEKDRTLLLCVALLTHSLFYYRNYFRVFCIDFFSRSVSKMKCISISAVIFSV